MGVLVWLFIGVIALVVLMSIAAMMALSTLRGPAWFIPPVQGNTEAMREDEQ